VRSPLWKIWLDFADSKVYFAAGMKTVKKGRRPRNGLS
jgi:hypothetical protein